MSVKTVKRRLELLRSFAKNRSLTAAARHKAHPDLRSGFLWLFFNPLRKPPLRTFERRRNPNEESQA
ncbi:MAG: hypothetical protein AW08_03859 [Candidatus Accumulibacter adjunctus]|uniref:Uncharacterized protein n=1 Tax=Candidatus Accumulibacter adjunctus TaxID=1454001 RepID=A0A011PC45_9PROT|nr:MAG: hypothetical protein AW08_03859 [Candidatus Accumulibacter adjunctus]